MRMLKEVIKMQKNGDSVWDISEFTGLTVANINNILGSINKNSLKYTILRKLGE